MKTGIITTDTYSNHNTGLGHPENADRVSVVIENLKIIKNKNFVWKKPNKFDTKYLKITLIFKLKLILLQITYLSQIYIVVL